MTTLDYSQPPFAVPISTTTSRESARDLIGEAMQRAGLLETPAPSAALRWIETFIDAYGDRLGTVGDALPYIRALRAEAVIVPAADLERLRNRQILFFLDTIGQYVDAQSELRDLPLEHDLAEIADEFGISREDALWAVRMALFGESEGPPLELLFPLLGHDCIMLRVGAMGNTPA
jgi:hypothetical protein